MITAILPRLTCPMAKVQDPAGSGLLPGGVVIDPLGHVYHHHRPRDARTPAQLRYRQAMRGLYNVLPNFGDAIDAAIKTALGTSSWWSSQTFKLYAADHLAAIAEDLDNYGRAFGFGDALAADDFNRADAETPGSNWDKLYFQGYPPNENATDFPIRSNRLRLLNGPIGMYLWHAPTGDDVDLFITAIGQRDNQQRDLMPFWVRLLFRMPDAIYPLYEVDVDYNRTITLYKVTLEWPFVIGTATHLWGENVSYQIGASVTGDRIDVYAARHAEDWAHVIHYVDPEPLTGNRVGFSATAGWNPGDPAWYCELDDFGLTTAYSQEVRDQWNDAAHSIGISDLVEPVPPFNYGEAGELLFLTCARLWHIAPTGAEMDPTGTDPQDWLTYLATGSFPP